MDSITQEFLQLRDAFIEKQYDKLNDKQREAVFTTEGGVLILAGAGSGKTTVVVNRIAYLMRYGHAHGSTEVCRRPTEADCDAMRSCIAQREVPADASLRRMLQVDPVTPWNIMAITFTNKAAGELKSRLTAMLGEEGGDVFATTFHSACANLMRRKAGRDAEVSNAELLGYKGSFTIYDTDDSQRVMKQIYKDLNVDEKFIKVKTMLNHISALKDKLISPKDAAAAAADTRATLIAKVYAEYETRLKKADAMDFDGLIYRMVELLQEHPEVRKYYNEKYRYLMVDEYQDTSYAQFELVRLLTGAEHNLCVVGDDDQSIYSFRGATIENILQFENRFRQAQWPCTVVKLEQNYRSTSNILNAANEVIAHNTGRHAKKLWTASSEGEKVRHYTALNEEDEAKHIVDVIAQHLQQGKHLADHAVLYRTNAQSAPIEQYFTRAGIPHKIVGGQRFNDRKEVKDIHSYLSLLVNPADDVRLRRIINVPARKIGEATIDRVSVLASEQGVPMMEIIHEADQYSDLGRTAGSLMNFYRMYDQLRDMLEEDETDLAELTSRVIEDTGYKRMLEADGEEGADRLQNLGQLVSNVQAYCDEKTRAGETPTLEGYLEEIALISDIDSYNESDDQVVLMTIHSAKGLEFPYVFLVGMEESLFPGEASIYEPEELEEERRLCYVGITRAKKELYLSSAAQRLLYGQTRRNEPSRFLAEIDPQCIEESESPVIKRTSARGWGAGFASDDESGYSSSGSRYGGYGSGYGSGYSRSSGNRGYLNSKYNARPAYPARSTGVSRFGSGTTPAKTMSADSYARPAATAPTRPTAATTALPKKQAGMRYAVGDTVEHKIFGKGTVLNVSAMAGDQLVEVKFDRVGIKKTMANYAPMHKI